MSQLNSNLNLLVRKVRYVIRSVCIYEDKENICYKQLLKIALTGNRMVKIKSRKKKSAPSQLNVEKLNKLKKDIKRMKKLYEKKIGFNSASVETDFLEKEIQQTKQDLMLAAIQNLRLLKKIS